MNFDRNTVIGFIVLALLFFGYFYFTNKEQSDVRMKKAIQDSITNANKPRFDTATVKIDSARADSVNKIITTGVFYDPSDSTENLIFAENSLLKIAFTKDRKSVV